MGYDLHITRRESWADNGDDITTSEWLAIVEQDPDLRLLGENGPYFAAVHDVDGEENWWLDWSDGQIYTKNPDPELIDKMVEIANKLAAVVQGDDGELYERGEKPWETAPLEDVEIKQSPPKMSFWDNVKGRILGRKA